MANPRQRPQIRAKKSPGPEQAAKPARKPAPKSAARKGNRRAVSHGAHAQVLPARLSAKAAAIAAELAVQAPVRGPGGALPIHDVEVVRLLAQTLCRLEDLSVWLDKHGTLDRRGKVRSAALWERRLSSQALKLLSALGMTPSSRVKLGLALARTVDLATAMSERDPSKRERLLSEAGLQDPQDAVEGTGGGDLE
jgi:hypothetical protein